MVLRLNFIWVDTKTVLLHLLRFVMLAKLTSSAGF